MKTIILVAIGLVLLVPTYILMRKNLSAKFYNKTGRDIDSLFIGTTFIGHIANNDSTYLIGFRKFHFDSGYPYEKLKGNVQNKSLSQLYWSWCGTERYTKKDGSYNFDIKMQDQGNKTYLYLDNHNGNLFQWK